MALHESGEMYLETIYILSRKSPYVRGTDISEYMNYSKPSVSRAVGLLKKDGLITTDEFSHIRLTEKGEEKARCIYDRHTTLTKMLINLGVNEETAADDACRMEHYISDESFNAIKAHLAEHHSHQE